MECFDISNISTTPRGRPRWFVSAMGFQTRTITGVTACARAGQDDFASMAEVVRRRYSRILLEARAANSDAAEFSQENAADAWREFRVIPSEAKEVEDPEAKPKYCSGIPRLRLGMTRVLLQFVYPT
jgi:hypothetical protein